MQITLNNVEIQEAITSYIATQGINLVDKVTDVTFTAGRGEKGYSATVDIKPKAASVIVQEAADEPETTEVADTPTEVVESTEEEEVTETQGSLFNRP